MRLRWVLVLGLAVAVPVTALLVRKQPRPSSPRSSARSQGTEPTTDAGEKTGPVGGTVRPARRASVRYYAYGDGETPVATVEAGEDGAFRFPESVGKKGVLLAEAEGFRPGWLAMSDLGDVKLVLEPGEPFAYRVTDPEGAPIAGAQVEVWYLYKVSGGGFTRDRFATDASGVVEVNAGPAERLTITAEGFEPRTIQHPERTADARWRTIVLAPFQRIGGRVVDPGGQPLAGAEVRYRHGFQTPWDRAPAVRADAAGRFETPPLPQKEYVLLASAEGWAQALAVVWPGDTEVEMRLERPARVEGRVLLPGGAPAVGAQVWAGGADPLAHAAADGTFCLDGIPPGTVEIFAWWYGPTGAPDVPDDTNWRCSWPPFQMKPGESRTGLDLTLSGACYSCVPLRLVDALGAPLAGVPVDTGSLSKVENGETKTDASGFVLIRTLDPPGYETRFEFPGGERFPIRTLPPGTSEVVEVKFRAPVRITFIVQDRDGALIPPGAHPVVHISGGGEFPVAGDRVEVRVTPALEDANVEYLVRATGFASGWVDAWVPDPAGETIEVRLEPEAVVRGKVTAADGTPLAGLEVTCRDKRRETDEAGAFLIDCLAPGPALLRVEDPDSSLPLLRRPLELHAGSNDLGVLAAPASEIVRGRVTDTAGRAVSGASIELLEPGEESQLLATSRADGTFFLRVYEPEMVRVIARKPGFGAALADGGTDLLLTLPADSPVPLRVPPEVQWNIVRITLSDGSQLRPEYGADDEPDTWRLVQMPPGPLTIEFLGRNDRVTATCTDRVTVTPRR